jgi:hypothetical protein
MTKKKVPFQENQGDKYDEGWVDMEVHQIEEEDTIGGLKVTIQVLKDM